MSRNRPVYINEAFRPQRVSGQQRYAGEIADRLPAEYIRLRPEGRWAESKLLMWLWVQTILPAKSWRGVLLSMTARAPLWHPRHAVVIHDLFVLEHPEWFSRLYYLTHAPLQRFQMATSRLLLAVSHPVAEQIRAVCKHTTVLTVPNAPSSVFAARGTDDERSVRDRGLTAGSYLVAVGNLEPRKNLARLAKAYGQLSAQQRDELPLVVVGAGADIFKTADVVWPDGTMMAGYVTDAELRALYAASGAVVFPSLAEGFGLPLVEAAVAGATRFVISDIEVFRWICGDSPRYVDPRSVEDIASGLESVGAELTSGAKEPRPVDISRFTWDASAKIVAGALLHLL